MHVAYAVVKAGMTCHFRRQSHSLAQGALSSRDKQVTGQAHSMTLIAVDCIRKRRIPQNEMKMVIWSHLSRSEPLNPLTSIQSQGVECTLDEVSGAFICPSIGKENFFFLYMDTHSSSVKK